MLVETDVPVAADVLTLWRVVTDWPRHSAWVPLTRVRLLDPVPNGPPGLGTRFVGRTGVGPVGFDDPMEVVVWEPPPSPDGRGRCEVTKQGRVVRGRAWIEVEAAGVEASVLRWGEQVVLAPAALTAPLDRLTAPLVRRQLRSVLRRIAADAEREGGSR